MKIISTLLLVLSLSGCTEYVKLHQVNPLIASSVTNAYKILNTKFPNTELLTPEIARDKYGITNDAQLYQLINGLKSLLAQYHTTLKRIVELVNYDTGK